MRERDIGDEAARCCPQEMGAIRETLKQSADKLDEKQILRPIGEVSETVGLSPSRLAYLLRAGKIQGEKRRVGRGPENWFVTVAEIDRYKSNLPSPADFGRKGGLVAGRGRRKSEKNTK